MSAEPNPRDVEMGAHLRRLRERIRPPVSQGDLARALGWHRPAITIIEGGKQSVRARDLPALASALGCSPVALLPVAWRRK